MSVARRSPATALRVKGDGAGEDNQPPATLTPQKRPRGRPHGSRNKVSQEAREVLAKRGPAVFERLCRMALGKPIYGERDEKGRRAKRYPTDDQSLVAAKLVVERLVPVLKAQELTGAGGSPLSTVTVMLPRDVAKGC